MGEVQHRTVVDFDHHSRNYAENHMEIGEELRTKCPIAWTESYGGTWVVSKHEHVAEVLRDPTYTVRHDIPNDGVSYTGVLLPEAPQLLIPMEIDGPVFRQYRSLLNPWFGPRAVAALRPRITDFVTWCFDNVVESGEIDLIFDLGNPVPALTTLQFLGLPLEDWEFYAYPYHDMAAFPVGSAGFDRAVQGIGLIHEKLLKEFADRRANPRADRITELTQARIDGELITDDILLAIVGLILAGGVDTTTALIGHTLHYLDENHTDRQRLIDDPTLIPRAGEEMLRYRAPGQTHVRTAERDMVLGGQQIKEGERVLLCLASANYDADVFPEPEKIKIDRTPNHHTSFGFGYHRCIGAAVARLEFEVVMEELLKRIPDYELTDGSVEYTTIGMVYGWAKMPARFTPGKRIGTDLDDILPTPVHREL